MKKKLLIAAALLVVAIAMAQEIQNNFTFIIENGALYYRTQKTVTAEQTGTGMDAVTVLAEKGVPTNMVFGSLATPCKALLQNLSTNEVEIGRSVSNVFERLLLLTSQEALVVSLASNVVLQANSVEGTNYVNGIAFEK